MATTIEICEYFTFLSADGPMFVLKDDNVCLVLALACPYSVIGVGFMTLAQHMGFGLSRCFFYRGGIASDDTHVYSGETGQVTRKSEGPLI